MPDPMNHPVEEFGLTVPAARAILSEDVHKEMLNRLLENQRFGQLTHTMFYALEPNQTEGIMSRDNLLAYGGSLLMPAWTACRNWNAGILITVMALLREITCPALR